MKEFIEKLIGRLEELNQSQIEKYTESLCDGNLDCVYDKTDIEDAKVKTTYEIIQIVNQLAEEYRQDLDKNSQGWIPCSSGTMPNENETIMLTFKNSAGLHVGEATYKNNMFFYVTDTEFGYYEEVYKNPIAWKTKDAPYQPKGE